MLSLALNLALTGVFILIVKRLINGIPESPHPWKAMSIGPASPAGQASR